MPRALGTETLPVTQKFNCHATPHISQNTHSPCHAESYTICLTSKRPCHHRCKRRLQLRRCFTYSMPEQQEQGGKLRGELHSLPCVCNGMRIWQLYSHARGHMIARFSLCFFGVIVIWSALGTNACQSRRPGSGAHHWKGLLLFVSQPVPIQGQVDVAQKRNKKPCRCTADCCMGAERHIIIGHCSYSARCIPLFSDSRRGPVCP